MQIEITGRHVEITEPIKQYVEKRLRKFTKLFVEPIDVHVIVIVYNVAQLATNSLTVGISGGAGGDADSPSKRNQSGARNNLKNAPTPHHPLHAVLGGTHLTEPASRCHKNNRSEVEPKRAKRLCERHLFPL